MSESLPTIQKSGLRRSPAVGIDLGTTYSCIAVCENGEVTVIQNEIGVNTTPSHVAFPELSDSSDRMARPSVTVGDPAKRQAAVNPANSIHDVKRLIGRKYNDPVVQKDMQRWPFTIVNEDNSPRVQVNGRSYHPEQISAKVLAYLKQQAEIQLECPVTDAVITVPAYFNDGQRQATKDAGTIAGLNVLRIINEPTAAAIAYNHQLQQQTLGSEGLSKKNVLIFDLGGGTFDLALLTMEGGHIVVKAVDGDTHLGGQDFDNALVDYCIEEFKRTHNIDLSQCQPNVQNARKEKFNLGKRLRRIKNECETSKINLSGSPIARISLEVIIDQLDLKLKITREIFESINEDLFKKCIDIVDRILGKAKMSKDEVDDVVLVGGSSRIPKIQHLIQEYFGREPCRSIKQDEAVAYGAAVQASQMTLGNMTDTEGCPPLPTDSELPKVVFTDVIPHSIGVQVHVGEGDVNDFSAILQKNTPVPCVGGETYYTGYRGQKEALISIYEGQSESVAENHLLGEFVIDNLPPDSPRGEPVDIHMEMNEEGILKVTAECPGNSTVNNITVKALNGRLKRREVEQFRDEELSFQTMSYSVLETFEQD